MPLSEPRQPQTPTTAVTGRSQRERLAAWLLTGPLGHLYAALAGLAVALLTIAVDRLRARVRRLRGGRAAASGASGPPRA